MSSGGGSDTMLAEAPFDCVRTSPTKRSPLRAMVRIRCWSLPLSPIALRAALMRLVSVESDTIRPPQTAAIRSSLLTTRSRFSTRIDQQIEHLRFDRNSFAAAPQLAAIGIKRMIGKEKFHVAAPESNNSATLRK